MCQSARSARAAFVSVVLCWATMLVAAFLLLVDATPVRAQQVWGLGDNSNGRLGIGDVDVAMRQVSISSVIYVAASDATSLAVKSDGTLWGWGRNDAQLGDGTMTQQLLPVQAVGINDVIKVAAGYNHSEALKNDGTVWACGRNDYGEVGDGSSGEARRTFVRVVGLTDVTAVTAGTHFSAALKADGTVWCWGQNDHGQLGDGTIETRVLPVQVIGLSGVRAIVAGPAYCLAAKEDGTVWAWGNNYDKQLGDGTTEDRHMPVQVVGLTGVSSVVARRNGPGALKNDGTVWVWGVSYGSAPVQIAGIDGVAALVAGDNFLALKADGSVWGWGANDSAQLGVNLPANVEVPVQLSGLADITAIAAGASHTLCLTASGQVYAMGSNSFGQLGDGTSARHLTPVQVQIPVPVLAVCCTTWRTYALAVQGQIWSWGGFRRTPVLVEGLSDVVAVSASEHVLALKSDGTVWAWGNNSTGQLGDGTNISRDVPTQVPGLSGVVAVAAGNNYSLALKADGTVWAWGGNPDGTLGDGTRTGRSSPVRTLHLTNIATLAPGPRHALATSWDGVIWAWGDNSYGQLAADPVVERRRVTPAPVPLLPDISIVSAGEFSSLALWGSRGSVYAWGTGFNGELGLGSEVYGQFVPTLIPGLEHIRSVSSGPSASLAVTEDGRVWGWGSNSYGVLGSSAAYLQFTPVELTGLSNVHAASCGQMHSQFLTRSYTTDAVVNAQATPAVVVRGHAVVLSVSPAAGSSSDSALWYFRACDGPLAAIGASATVFPTSTCTYYVRAFNSITGSIGQNCASVSVVVTAGWPDLDDDDDVDAADFNLFRACLSGPGVEHDGSVLCDQADGDRDGDVDQEDFGVFQRCMSGAGGTPDTHCADL